MSPDQSIRPNKRIKEAHFVSVESSRAPSPTAAPAETLLCSQLLLADLPPSLATDGNDVHAFREVWMAHGFRTSLVTSPTKAVSIFLDSCRKGSVCPGKEAGRTFLLSCVGMHPQQKKLEEEYYLLKGVYCLSLFLTRLCSVRREDMEDDRVRNIWEADIQHIVNELKSGVVDTSRLQNIVNSSSKTLSQLLSKLTEIDRSLRTDQLLCEYNRISHDNCTLTNACMHRWLYGQDSREKKQTFCLDQVYFQCSPVGRYMPDRERVTIHMSDDNDKQSANDTLIFLPSLHQVLTRGDTSCHPLDAVVEGMSQTTWDDLLKNGYYVDQARKEQLSDSLKKFYLSGLLAGRDSNMPILINAHFTPTYPLSLYLYGTAGAGKSSLVRNLFPAINAAISTYCDPELLVKFVKQNLNKPFETLQLELELRPNNNDYSVMSIIQGRRMTLSQSKPGLVLVALEEMPNNVKGNDPNQLEVSKLISMRFSGRKGEFKDGDAPRNSAKRGISGDATLINIFTSNYDLEQPCADALQRLKMFQNLQVVHMVPVSGQDRKAFAKSYLVQRVRENLSTVEVNICIDVPFGDGDIRPLVRYLQMLSFYIHSIVLNSMTKSASNAVDVSVTFDSTTNTTIVTASNGTSLQLRSGSFDNIYSDTPLTLDPRASDIAERLQTLHLDLKHSSELCQILDFYFAKTFNPAVVVSKNKQLIKDLVNILSRSDGVHGISNINPSDYKIMKSLYDASDIPNLRDDILDILHANPGAYVAIELHCNTADSQMQIREIIEDTPSMTAFSTERSALQKDGLFFGVFVKDSITAEIKSRASLVI